MRDDFWLGVVGLVLPFQQNFLRTHEHGARNHLSSTCEKSLHSTSFVWKSSSLKTRVDVMKNHLIQFGNRNKTSSISVEMNFFNFLTGCASVIAFHDFDT